MIDNIDLRAKRHAALSQLGIEHYSRAHWNLLPEELTEHAIRRGEGHLASSGALLIYTGEFTGRSPKDRFIVEDKTTADLVDWNKINKPFSSEKFELLYQKMIDYLSGLEIFVRDAYACADENYRLNLRLITEYPSSNLFGHNMFLRPKAAELEGFQADWTIVCAPGFKASPMVDGTRQGNFAIIHFTRKLILVGGTGYTGEIKKGVFSVLNLLLPHQKEVLAMHCSANVGKDGDAAIFFGLSGTGKTTLSADPNRALIGDDEHGWSKEGIFNFEGGCYAKTINLSAEKEPEIYAAIKPGAILENLVWKTGSREPDFEDTSITQNTRVSYPIHHIENALPESKAGHPKNVFFLTCDAFGVLPPISKLTPGQAMYYFISGYTAKVAGTECGVDEPEATFSACFGAPFLPLHPTKYAEMLKQRMEEFNANVWLVNTGWTGGEFGVGKRIKLKHTRAMISAALRGKLDQAEFVTHPTFGLMMPENCPNVPNDILNPRQTWKNKENYDQKADLLAQYFVENFEQFADQASKETLKAAPKVAASTT